MLSVFLYVLGILMSRNFFRNAFVNVLSKQRLDDTWLEWVMLILFFSAKQVRPPSSPNSPCNALNNIVGLSNNILLILFFFKSKR